MNQEGGQQSRLRILCRICNVHEYKSVFLRMNNYVDIGKLVPVLSESVQ